MRKLLYLLIILVFIFSIAVPTVDVVAKGPTIEELQKKITVLTKQVKDLTTKFSLKTIENDKLRKEKSTLQSQIKSKDSKISQLNDEIESQEERIKEQETRIEEQGKEIEQLKELVNANFIYTDSDGNIVPNSTSNAIKWYEFKGKKTTIYLTQKAYEEFGYVIDIQDDIVNSVSRYFNRELTENIPVFISFDESLSGLYWGDYNQAKNRIFVRGSSFSPYNLITRENVADAFAHELVHAYQDITMNLFNSLPPNDSMVWLYEGMAAYVEFQVDNYNPIDIPKDHVITERKYEKEKYKEKILRAMKENNVSSLTKLPERRYIDHGYDIYESIIYFIENNYGHDKLMTFTGSFDSRNQSFETIFGNEEKFMGNWNKYFGLN